MTDKEHPHSKDEPKGPPVEPLDEPAGDPPPVDPGDVEGPGK